ncbi:hypothetical protein CEJ88_15605 [Staphylococcus aureus]|nr:hypothetical protein CEJ88_15605 [Staphylococcus aureus]
MRRSGGTGGGADVAKSDREQLDSLRNGNRGGSVCLNSFGRFVKWISAAIMPPPSLVSAR